MKVGRGGGMRVCVRFTVSWMLTHGYYSVCRKIYTHDQKKNLCCALSSQTISIEKMVEMKKTRHTYTLTHTHKFIQYQPVPRENV